MQTETERQKKRESLRVSSCGLGHRATIPEREEEGDREEGRWQRQPETDEVCGEPAGTHMCSGLVNNYTHVASGFIDELLVEAKHSHGEMNFPVFQIKKNAISGCSPASRCDLCPARSGRTGR